MQAPSNHKPVDSEPAALAPTDPAVWKTQLHRWQRDLVERLERGIGRPLLPADLACVDWDHGRKTLSVVTQPLMGELKRHNLVSHVFRTWKGRTAF
jgi:hypothetical protein